MGKRTSLLQGMIFAIALTGIILKGLGVNAEDSHLLVPHLGVVNFICCVN
jgi:hypothetical protein